MGGSLTAEVINMLLKNLLENLLEERTQEAQKDIEAQKDTEIISVHTLDSIEGRICDWSVDFNNEDEGLNDLLRPLKRFDKKNIDRLQFILEEGGEVFTLAFDNVGFKDIMKAGYDEMEIRNGMFYDNDTPFADFEQLKEVFLLD